MQLVQLYDGTAAGGAGRSWSFDQIARPDAPGPRRGPCGTLPSGARGPHQRAALGMYILGHVGIGVHLIPERLRKPVRWLALGCVLPDLLDKPWWLLMKALHAQQAGTRLPSLPT